MIMANKYLRRSKRFSFLLETMISVSLFFNQSSLEAESRHIGRNSQLQKIAESDKPIGISCNHLGERRTVEWIIEIDKGSRGKPTGDMVQIEAN